VYEEYKVDQAITENEHKRQVHSRHCQKNTAEIFLQIPQSKSESEGNLIIDHHFSINKVNKVQSYAVCTEAYTGQREVFQQTKTTLISHVRQPRSRQVLSVLYTKVLLSLSPPLQKSQMCIGNIHRFVVSHNSNVLNCTQPVIMQPFYQDKPGEVVPGMNSRFTQSTKNDW